MHWRRMLRESHSRRLLGNVPVTQVEAVVQPDCVTDDSWRKSVAFVCVHAGIVDSRQLLANTLREFILSGTIEISGQVR